MNFQRLSLIVILYTYTNCIQAQVAVNPIYSNISLDFESRAADLVSKMTLEEKISLQDVQWAMLEAYDKGKEITEDGDGKLI